MAKASVLFICTANAVRSQMAEAFLRQYGGKHFDVYSAGLQPTGVHPLTVRVMDEAEIDIRSQWSKHIDDVIDGRHFDHIITVCDSAKQVCPSYVFDLGQQTEDWGLEDPAQVNGTEEEQLAAFRKTRNRVAERVQLWLDDYRTGRVV